MAVLANDKAFLLSFTLLSNLVTSLFESKEGIWKVSPTLPALDIKPVEHAHTNASGFPSPEQF
jgi:hypothetical protein